MLGELLPDSRLVAQRRREEKTTDLRVLATVMLSRFVLKTNQIDTKILTISYILAVKGKSFTSSSAPTFAKSYGRGCAAVTATKKTIKTEEEDLTNKSITVLPTSYVRTQEY